MVYKLPQSALNVIDAYWNLKVSEGKHIRCPYFRNPRSGRDRWGLTAYSGKGSPQEIEDELRIIEKLEGVEFSEMQESEIRDIMKKRRLGIECSGFIVRVLDAWTRERYRKPIYSLLNFNTSGLGWIYSKLRPYTHIDVETLVHPKNAREVHDVQTLQPGDLMRFNTTIDHAVLITQVERGETGGMKVIHYAESILEENGEGLKRGTIIFTNSASGDLVSQSWSEEPQTGHTINEKGEPKIYRLHTIENCLRKTS